MASVAVAGLTRSKSLSALSLSSALAARRRDVRGNSGRACDILGVVEESEPLEGADADVAVAEARQYRRAGRRRLVTALQFLAGLEQSEALRRVDAERFEHLGREHLADPALERQPAVGVAAVRRLARTLGAEVEQAIGSSRS